VGIHSRRARNPATLVFARRPVRPQGEARNPLAPDEPEIGFSKQNWSTPGIKVLLAGAYPSTSWQAIGAHPDA
jgi:hypothetical protein